MQGRRIRKQDDGGDAHQRQASGQAVDTVHHVERIHQPDHGNHRHRNAEPAQRYFVTEDAPQRMDVHAAAGNDSQDDNGLDQQPIPHAEIEAVIQRTEQHQHGGGTQQDHFKPLELSVASRARRHADEDREPAHQRHVAVVLLALIRMIHQPPQDGEPTQHDNGHRRRACSNQAIND